MYKLLIADNSFLTRQGLRSLVKDLSIDIEEVTEPGQLSEAIVHFKPDVLVIDPVGFEVNPSRVAELKELYNGLYILAITHAMPQAEISAYLSSGITSFLLKCCDKEEIFDALESTRRNERFLCGKVANILVRDAAGPVAKAGDKKVSCEGFAVSEREIEVIKLIAFGLSNKQIADKLCLSLHTVNTHRKNILQKLKVNNTAGVVMFAVRNNLLSEELPAN